MTNIHWIGNGLSSNYGITYLNDNRITNTYFWARNTANLTHITKTENICRFTEINEIATKLSAGDIVISMLPANMHYEIARIALDNNCHFICTSYISDKIISLHQEAKTKNLSLVCEMGLDPGIDHYLTFYLLNKLDEFKNQKINILSLCGGLAQYPGEFCYKFSWSPVGILRALKQQAIWLENGQISSAEQAWHRVNSINISNEQFEYYPNRNSLNFMKYFDLSNVNCNSFLRGSIRNYGWSNAWQYIFKQLPNLNEEELILLSAELYNKYKFATVDDYDRVLMYIRLQVLDNNYQVTKQYSAKLDQIGNSKFTAMSQLVCLPVINSIKSILQGNYITGLTRPTKNKHDIEQIVNFLKENQVEIFLEENPL